MIEQEFADIYPLTAENLVEYLPDIDCAECGLGSCMDFAADIIGKKVKAGQCPELSPELALLIDSLIAFVAAPIPYNIMMESFPPSLVRVGEPTESSPVIVTGNFQETVRLLEGILNACNSPVFLIMSDTKGYSVDNAIPEKRFTAFEILKAITETEAGSLVNHRNLVIPGLAKQLAGQIKQTTGWRVMVGPVSGLELPLYLMNEALVGP